ncbi:MAG: hypothetical protein AAFO69_07275 [Bacteroidota bacterium]
MWRKTIFFLPFAISLVVACQPAGQSSGQNKNPYQVVQLSSPADSLSSLPYLLSGFDNHLYLSWVTNEDTLTTLNFAKYNGQQWSEAKEIASGEHWFVNWADYPMISVNSNGQLLAHFLAKNADGTYSYDVNLTSSQKGDTWRDAVVPHKDQTPTEHGFVTMLPHDSGQFTVTWLDGRNTEQQGAMTLRGATVSADLEVSQSEELDNRVCDCCQTGGTITDNGPVIVYRNRSEVEWRDIYIVRKVANQWTEPSPVFEDRWEIAGCPVNGPRADALGNELVVAWYTAAAGQPKVKVSFSKDGGATFASPIIVDYEKPLGRVDVVMLDAGKAMVSWLATGEDDQKAYVSAMLVAHDGSKGPVLRIAESSRERASGFPQMALYGGELFFAWTSVQDDTPVIEMAKIQL